MRTRRAPPSLLTFKPLEGESFAEIPFEVLTSNRKVKLMPRERDIRFRIPWARSLTLNSIKEPITKGRLHCIAKNPRLKQVNELLTLPVTLQDFSG